MRKIMVCMWAAALLLPQLAGAQSRPNNRRAAFQPVATGESAAAARQSTPAMPAESGRKEAGAAETAAARLPVRRVVLYKNGVGYFEHLGRVRGSQDVTIDFTSGQLNDVLKSLTILDLGKGRITGVSYNSEAPLGRRLGTLRLPVSDKPSVAEFLGALRGARLEVRSGAGAVTGRLLSVEKKTRTVKDQTIETDEISLVTDAGEVRTAELGPATSVRIAERDLNQEVSLYLGLLATTREKDLRRMTISTAGTGDRQLYVSYISEVPLWKTTYRLVLPSKPGAKPILQGWAIVDNTVGEDWSDVELSLVAGAPQSFIQQLSQPYYARRPVVPLPESVQLTPQTHAATLVPGAGELVGEVKDPQGAAIPNAAVRVYDDANQLLAQTSTDEEGNYAFDALPLGNYRVEIQAAGFQTTIFSGVNVAANQSNQLNANLPLSATSESMTLTTLTPPAKPRAIGRVGAGHGGGVGGGVPGGQAGGVLGGIMASTSEARSRAEAAARGQELGDMFEYKLKERVTIRKNQSALVPIIQTDITAEKVSLWNQASSTPRPLRALWLTNSSALTLDRGSFSVLEDETFAGEGLLEPIKPGEKRLLSYAADLGVLVDTKLESDQQHVTRVRVARGVMIQSSELREGKTYTVRNEDTTPRSVVIEHPVRPEWKLAADGPKPEEISTGLYRFRLTVEPKKTATLVVREARPLETRYALGNLTDDQIALFLRERTINPGVEQALRRIVAQKNEVAKVQVQIEQRQKEISRIFEDQQRLRENMKALKGSAEEKTLTQRYTRQLADQETRLETLRREMADLEGKRQQAQAVLDTMIQELALDVNL